MRAEARLGAYAMLVALVHGCGKHAPASGAASATSQILPTSTSSAFAGDPPQVLPKPESAEHTTAQFEARFKSVDDLVKWLLGEGHAAKRQHAKKAFKMVHAVDGDNVLVDGHDLECYVFLTQPAFDSFDEYLQGLSEAFGSKEHDAGSSDTPKIATYVNARCL